MNTYGNNAIAIVQSDIVEELTAYTDKELSLLVENAYNVGRREERTRQRREARQKRKSRQETISAIVFSVLAILICFGFFAYWLMIGY